MITGPDQFTRRCVCVPAMHALRYLQNFLKKFAYLDLVYILN